jgi:hypothetical protein
MPTHSKESQTRTERESSQARGRWNRTYADKHHLRATREDPLEYLCWCAGLSRIVCGNRSLDSLAEIHQEAVIFGQTVVIPIQRDLRKDMYFHLVKDGPEPGTSDAVGVVGSSSKEFRL